MVILDSTRIECREKLSFVDVGYAASYDLADSIEIQKEFTLIQLGEKDPMEYYNKLDRYYDDQTVFNSTLKRYFEPLDIAKAGNKLVNEGLEVIAQSIISGKSTNFDNYAIGEGTASVNVTDTQLSDEIQRLDILTNGGFVQSRGTTIFYGVFFPKTMISATITETGINNSLDKTIDKMLLRTLFPSDQYITHVKNFDTVSVGHIIYAGSR